MKTFVVELLPTPEQPGKRFEVKAERYSVNEGYLTFLNGTKEKEDVSLVATFSNWMSVSNLSSVKEV